MNFDDHIPGARGPEQSELSTIVEALLREAKIPEHLIQFCLKAVAEGEAAKRDLEDARAIDALAHDRWSRT